MLASFNDLSPVPYLDEMLTFPKTNFGKNFNQNTKLFIKENAFENVYLRNGSHFVQASMC